jgi:dUTP pyrophosphatase
MTQLKLKIKRLDPRAILPTKAHASDAGFDLYAISAGYISADDLTPIRLGFSAEIPEGYYCQVFGRSSLAKQGVVILGGVIDSGFRGEWTVLAACVSRREVWYEAGARIAQCVILPVPRVEVVEVEELGVSERGTDGFGSSGV